jgi:O-antigen ligase
VQGGAPGNETLLLLGCGLTLLSGRRLATANPTLFPLLVGLGAVSAVLLGQDAVRRLPLAGPLGYGNADGALAAQACAAFCLAAASSRAEGRRVLLLVAGGTVVATVLTGSKAASVLAAVVVVVALAPSRRAIARAVAVAGAAGLLASVALTVLLAATYTSHHRIGARIVDSTLTARRPLFWHDALLLVRSEPAFGVGPNRYAGTSPLARKDPADDRWAHSEFLQQAAESGVVGGALLTGVVLWGFAAAHRSTRPAGVVAVGAAGWAAMTVQAAQDYTLHYGAVPLIAAALLGAATGTRPPSPRTTASSRARRS